MSRLMVGNRASLGFVSQEEETELGELPVDGSLPDWLRGALIRTGPAKWEVGRRTMNHWFDGLAMLHRFEVVDGRVTYASRFLETKAYRAARDRLGYGEFAPTRPGACSSAWRRCSRAS
jgi:beta,beta-carotene 9',10'-dioxygenase